MLDCVSKKRNCLSKCSFGVDWPFSFGLHGNATIVYEDVKDVCTRTDEDQKVWLWGGRLVGPWEETIGFLGASPRPRASRTQTSEHRYVAVDMQPVPENTGPLCRKPAYI